MHPEFIRIGSLDIRMYGVLLMLGFVAGLYAASWRARRVGLPPQLVMDLGVWVIVAAMIGAKLFYMAFEWRDFVAAWRMDGPRSLRQGFVFYGGFIGACVATVVFARHRRVPLWKLADVMAPSVALGHAFGRVGCFMNGCCYGSACSLSWAVQYPAGHLAHSHPTHPVQLYEAAGNLLIFAGLSWGFGRRKRDGQIWWWYVLGYGVMRFGVEFFRGDYETLYAGVFTNAHLVASVMIALSIIMLARGHGSRTDSHARV